jgi:hypothetical protein
MLKLVGFRSSRSEPTATIPNLRRCIPHPSDHRPPTTPSLRRSTPIKRIKTLSTTPCARADGKLVIELYQAPTESRSRKLSTLSTTIHPGSLPRSSPNALIPGVLESCNRALLNGTNYYLISRRGPTSIAMFP